MITEIRVSRLTSPFAEAIEMAGAIKPKWRHDDDRLLCMIDHCTEKSRIIQPAKPGLIELEKLAKPRDKVIAARAGYWQRSWCGTVLIHVD
jgi:hypothetical protein